MYRTPLSAFLIIAIFGLTSAGHLFAQAPRSNQEKQTEKVKSKIKKLGLGQRTRVKVKLYNATRYEGYVSQANEEDFVVIDKAGNPNTLKYSDVQSVGGRNLSTGRRWRSVSGLALEPRS